VVSSKSCDNLRWKQFATYNFSSSAISVFSTAVRQVPMMWCPVAIKMAGNICFPLVAANTNADERNEDHLRGIEAGRSESAQMSWRLLH